MKKLILTLIFVTVTSLSFANEEIVFTGMPEIKIIEDGIDRTSERLSPNKSLQYKCTITKINTKYFWTTRENIELIAIPSRAYITFLATNGSGHVRIINPEMKKVASLLGGTEEKYDYVEHLLLGLRSVTYYGKRK